jgi:hypothetical protein
LIANFVALVDPMEVVIVGSRESLISGCFFIMVEFEFWTCNCSEVVCCGDGDGIGIFDRLIFDDVVSCPHICRIESIALLVSLLGTLESFPIESLRLSLSTGRVEISFSSI